MIGVRAYLNLKSLRKTASLLGISKSTIQRWVTSSPILREKALGRKITAEAGQHIADIVASNPYLTPAAIRDRIHADLKLSCSTSAVRFWMRRQFLSRKKASRHVCTHEVESKRHAFAKDYSAVYDPHRVVSVDESSFYFDMKPSHGYCHRSKRLNVPSKPGGRTRWSLLMAVTNARVVGWKLVKGSINSAIFSKFMASLETDQRDVVLLDNASIHKTNTAMDVMIERGLTPCFLPPYTPEFQPIEHAFSVLKNAFRRYPLYHDLGMLLPPSAMEQSVVRRLHECIPFIKSSVLQNQFDICWRRAAILTQQSHLHSDTVGSTCATTDSDAPPARG